MQIKTEFLDQLQKTFASQGVYLVDGEYDGINGMLTFYFRDDDIRKANFEYDSENAGLDSVPGFKELLFRVGGVIIQDYNSKFPKDNDKFIAAVTEAE